MIAIRRILAASWGQLIAVAVMLVSFRIYSSRLGPEAFGQAMLGLGVVSLLDGLGSMALSQVLAQLLKDLDDRQRRIGLALGLGMRFALYQAALYAIGAVLVGLWFGAGALFWFLPVAAVYCLCEIPRAAGATLAMLERRFGLVSGWNALDALVALGATLVFLAASGNSPIAPVLGALAGRSLSAILLSARVLGAPAGWRVDGAAARATLPRAMAFGWSIAVMSPLGWLGAFADRYLVGAFAGLADAGVIAALAGAVMRPYGVVSAGLTNLYRPDLLDLAAGREPLHPRPLRSWLAMAALIGLAGFGGFVVIGKDIADFLVRFPTPAIDRGGLVMVLAASQIIVLFTHAFENQLLAQGRSGTLLAGLCLALAAGLPMVGAAAAWGGANGAAWGRLGAELVRMITGLSLVWFATRQRMPRSEAMP